MQAEQLDTFREKSHSMEIVGYSVGLTGVMGSFWLDSTNYGRAN